MLRIGAAIGWIALAGCEPAAVRPREGAPPTTCAGPEQADCPIGQLCIDLADDGCDPEAGGVDCDGICVPSQCAGISNMECAGELVCVDDPDDDCDPDGDGSDCPGVCVEPSEPTAPEDRCAETGRLYVSREPRLCARVAFMCPASWRAFSDGCGCGCSPSDDG